MRAAANVNLPIGPVERAGSCRAELDGEAARPLGRRVVTGLNTRISGARAALHAGLGVLGWLILAALWVWQFAYVPDRWLDGLTLLGIILGVYVVLTPLWVAWNRGIYRRRHRRTTPLLRAVRFERDSLGRAIVGAPFTEIAPELVRVSLIAGGRLKCYAPERARVGNAPPRKARARPVR